MIAIAVILACAQVALIQIFIYSFAQELDRIMNAAGVPLDHPLHRFIGNQVDRLVNYGWVQGAVMATLNFIVFLVITQRIAGPIYRIKLTIQSWRNGNRALLRLRRGDFFQDVAEELQKLRDESSGKTEPENGDYHHNFKSGT
jgi:hypothetical protein